jgi:alkylation response protein AidB-like acyl-CoA dehydrogenase
MDFQLSDEQVLLRDTTRDLLSRSYDAESRNKVIASELGWSKEVWTQLAEIGILGLGFDPDEAGQLEVITVLTEVGRRLAPEPVVHAALGPGAIIAEIGNDAQKQLLDEVAEGQRLLAFAHLEPGARSAFTENISTTAVQQGDSWVLSGRKNPVLAGDSADTLVVSAKLPDGGIGLFLVDGEAVTRHPYGTFDGQRGAQIDLDKSPGEPLGDAMDASAAIRNGLVRIQSALCAEAVGAMARAHEITVDYLKIRKQFGAAIGSFQALQHRAVDMLVMIEQARSLAMYASMMSEDGDAAARSRAVSAAKVYIGRAGRFVGEQAIQLHGGIGVTEECAVGHYYRRLTMIDILFGDSAHHLAAVAGAGALP